MIKPAFFKHAELYEAECASGLPLRLAFAGLWTVADREGRFRWKIDLKTDILPYDAVDILRVLGALEQFGFVKSYVVDGKKFGVIPAFKQHQTFHHTERPSVLPAPVFNGESPVRSPADTVTVTVTGTGTDKIRQQPPQPEIANDANDEAELAARLESDADRIALTAVLMRSRSRVATAAAIAAMLSGNDPAVTPAPTPTVLGSALRDLAANGEVFSAVRFRGYLRRAAQPPPGTANTANTANTASGHDPPARHPRSNGRHDRPKPQQYTYPEGSDPSKPIKWT